MNVCKCGRVKNWEAKLRGGANCEMEGGGKYEEGKGKERKSYDLSVLHY